MDFAIDMAPLQAFLARSTPCPQKPARRLLSRLQVIYETRGRVFYYISKHREVCWKNEAQPSFFNALWGVWICDETLFRVFHITSKTSAYFRRKLRRNLGSSSHIQTPFRCWFPLFLSYEILMSFWSMCTTCKKSGSSKAMHLDMY